jgi:hypothetical protein
VIKKRASQCNTTSSCGWIGNCGVQPWSRSRALGPTIYRVEANIMIVTMTLISLGICSNHRLTSKLASSSFLTQCLAQAQAYIMACIGVQCFHCSLLPTVWTDFPCKGYHAAKYFLDMYQEEVLISMSYPSMLS